MVAVSASGRWLGNAVRYETAAVVTRASGRPRGEIGQIVAVSTIHPPAVTMLQIDEKSGGGGALGGVDAAAVK